LVNKKLEPVKKGLDIVGDTIEIFGLGRKKMKKKR